MDRNPRRAGQALVECALVMPLVVTLSLGVLQVVLYAHARAVLISAAQEGARMAAEDGRSVDQALARAHDLVDAGLGQSVNPVRMDASADDELVTFTLDTELRAILPVPLVGELPLHARAAIARERFRPGGGGA